MDLLVFVLTCFQGRFSQPLKAASTCMGQEFMKPGKEIPAWISEAVMTVVAKSFSNSTQVGKAGQ